MVDFFQLSSSIYPIVATLGIALIIITITALNMIEKKRISVFLPFFIFGLGVCLTAGFMIHDFFGVAVDVLYVFSFVSAGVMFVVIRGAGK